jgi:hypothetical protein
MIKFIKAWILTAFLAFVPKMTGGRMGTAFQDRQIEPIQPLPLNNFSLTSEKFFLFLPLPTACCLLPTASSRPALIPQPFAPKPQRSGIIRLVYGILPQRSGVMAQVFFLYRPRSAPIKPTSAPIQPDSAPHVAVTALRSRSQKRRQPGQERKALRLEA